MENIKIIDKVTPNSTKHNKKIIIVNISNPPEWSKYQNAESPNNEKELL